jgi:hypothetical protein
VKTLSGRMVLPASGCPTLLDIAIRTGRAARFGGATRGWWSVLHHHLVCRTIAIHNYHYNPHLALYATIHDGHEACSGDTPTTWKTDWLRAAQRSLDRRIYSVLLLVRDPGSVDRAIVKEIDHRALLAEAAVLGPPGFPEADHAKPKDVAIVRMIHRRYRGTISPGCRAVRDWIAAVEYDVWEIRRAS